MPPWAPTYGPAQETITGAGGGALTGRSAATAAPVNARAETVDSK